MGKAARPSVSGSKECKARLRQGGGWSENSHWRENRQLRAKFRGSAPDAGKISGLPMAVGVMEVALYSSYTLVTTPILAAGGHPMLMVAHDSLSRVTVRIG